ncbi:hypothetical protein J6590_075255 [Homalodisca vitripennis]|nr:hypothetical protein J6590_075255 [Homalodisca vitripennis]
MPLLSRSRKHKSQITQNSIAHYRHWGSECNYCVAVCKRRNLNKHSPGIPVKRWGYWCWRLVPALECLLHSKEKTSTFIQEQNRFHIEDML